MSDDQSPRNPEAQAMFELASETGVRMARIIGELVLENERLRAALLEIARHKPWLGDNPDFGAGHDSAREAAADVARAALKDTTRTADQ